MITREKEWQWKEVTSSILVMHKNREYEWEDDNRSYGESSRRENN